MTGNVFSKGISLVIDNYRLGKTMIAFLVNQNKQNFQNYIFDISSYIELYENISLVEPL